MVIVAMSTNSCESAYVTFEWSYALGLGRSLIPLKLSECAPHQRLKTIQYLDFSVPGALPWGSLIEQLRETEVEDENVSSADQSPAPVPNPVETSENGATQPLTDTNVRAIVSYMDERGIHAISFDNLRKRIDATFSDYALNQLILDHPDVLRRARLMTGKPGLAKKRARASEN